MKKFLKNASSSYWWREVIVKISLIIPLILPTMEAEARKFYGLKVHGDYRTLEPIVSDIPYNRSGVTKENVLNRVRQKLWESGIKPDRPRSNFHFLEIDLIMHSEGTNFSVEISLKKMAQAYGYDPRKVGAVIELPQGNYGIFGNARRDKGYVLDAVEEVLHEFITDYKESNLN